MSRFWPDQPVDPFVGYRNLPTPMSAGSLMVLPKQLRWPGFVNPTPHLGDGYGALGADSSLPSRVVQGPGRGTGYVYRQYSDGGVLIVSLDADPVNTYLRPNSGAAWESITRQIGAYGSGVGADPISSIIAAFRGHGGQRRRAVRARHDRRREDLPPGPW